MINAFSFFPETSIRNGRFVYFNGSLYEPMNDHISDDVIEPVLILAHKLYDEIIFVCLLNGFPMMEFRKVKKEMPASSNLFSFAKASELRKFGIKRKYHNMKRPWKSQSRN